MYDWKCFDLAETFLEKHPTLNNAANRQRLAQEIQETVDTFIQQSRPLLLRGHQHPARIGREPEGNG